MEWEDDKKYDPTESGVLSSTRGGGSRIDIAIGSKIIEIIMRDNLLSNSQKIGNMLLENFVDLVGINRLIDARGIGLMIGLNLILERLGITSSIDYLRTVFSFFKQEKNQ